MPSEPLLAVRFAAETGTIFVTRSLLLRGHETYDAGGNVIESREVPRWQRELVGTIRLAQFRCAGALRDELACLLFHAVVGLSRLPLTSVESPLPDFSVGRLGYFYRRRGGSAVSPGPRLLDLAAQESLSEVEQTKLLELAVRSTPPGGVVALAARCGTWPGAIALRLLRSVFNGISLSPYTDFMPKAVELLRHLVRSNVVDDAGRVNFLAQLMHQLARHLAAYDLVTFHHRGANYPDALLLQELLDELLRSAVDNPDLFAGAGLPQRLRRRAIRHGLLLRLAYAGHPVPDAPTSPGENRRVMPAPFAPVPEEQIYSPVTRTRRLFADEFEPDPALARNVFADLDDPAELCELGTALFLDRPFGFAKASGEPDQTLLASHLHFSKEIAAERLDLLRRRPHWLPDVGALGLWHSGLRELAVDGMALPKIDTPMRPGVVSLADAGRVAGDWMMLQTTRQTIDELARQYDLRPLVESLNLPVRGWRLLAPGGEPGRLLILDEALRLRAGLSADMSRGYVTRGGAEMLAAGLQVLQVWSERGKPQPLPADCRLPPAL